MFFDSNYLLFAIPGLLIGIYAQIKLSAAYGKYSRVAAQSGLSGAEGARAILDQAGLGQMPVREVAGHLTDHYDPMKRALFLSSENFHGRSLAALGVAAHEAGHALQHQAAYAPLKVRMMLVPVTQFASYAWVGIFLLGMFMQMTSFIWAAIAIFSVITLFQLVTLPVEYDASRRAKAQLLRLGLVHTGESEHVSRVLNAAALTYVAALVGSFLQLLHLLMIARGSNRS